MATHDRRERSGVVMWELSRKQLRLAALVYCAEHDIPQLLPYIEWVERETLHCGLARIIG